MPEIAKITGIGPALATACAEAGFSRVKKIARAKPAELAVVPGIGEVSAKTLIDAAQSLLNGAAEPEAQDTKPVKAKKDKKQAKTGKSNKDKKKANKNKKKGRKKKAGNQKESKKKSAKSGKKK